MSTTQPEALRENYTAADMATAAAQGFRDGVASVAASAGSKAVAWLVCTEEGDPDMVFLSQHEAQQYLEDDERPTPLYTHPSPPEGMVGGWVSVEDRLPEPNVEVLCAGQGWGNQFVTACYYDDERSEWYPINTHWTDATGQAQYPTHWRELPPAPSSAKGVAHG